jgi:leucyl-tRNA synthetase
MVTQALYPFAPHIAEEAWEHLGGQDTITWVPFPKANPTYLVEESATYVIQFNGKVRGQFDLPKNQTKEDLLSMIKVQPQFAKYLEGELLNVIYVPNKLINLVVKTPS